MLKIETMTLCDLATELRALGVKTSNDKLALAIEAGLYPFAISVRMPGSDRRSYEIYRKLFVKWVKERATETDGGVA